MADDPALLVSRVIEPGCFFLPIIATRLLFAALWVATADVTGRIDTKRADATARAFYRRSPGHNPDCHRGDYQTKNYDTAKK
tara:strand:- start:2605 stop:2850 length:246 start_codon:yes stop_codon:yes gene_type:complete